jgi:hypothetical protein
MSLIFLLLLFLLFFKNLTCTLTGRDGKPISNNHYLALADGSWKLGKGEIVGKGVLLCINDNEALFLCA